MSLQATEYGAGAMYPWYDFGVYDIDAVRITSSGRLVVFEFKHGESELEERTLSMLTKFPDPRRYPSIFLVKFSCENVVEGVCRGDMRFHGSENKVSSLNGLARMVLPEPKTFSKSAFEKWVVALA